MCNYKQLKFKQFSSLLYYRYLQNNFWNPPNILHITSDQTVDSGFANSIFKQFSQVYFDPIDVPALVNAYSQAYKTAFDKAKAEENGEFVLITTYIRNYSEQ